MTWEYLLKIELLSGGKSEDGGEDEECVLILPLRNECHGESLAVRGAFRHKLRRGGGVA